MPASDLVELQKGREREREERERERERKKAMLCIIFQSLFFSIYTYSYVNFGTRAIVALSLIY